ncbi:MAG: hypothetical protein N2Z84_01585 [Atribacterota bacterium]|nr:hypothetical protein [Atribacterota bacterium]
MELTFFYQSSSLFLFDFLQNVFCKAASIGKNPVGVKNTEVKGMELQGFPKSEDKRGKRNSEIFIKILTNLLLEFVPPVSLAFGGVFQNNEKVNIGTEVNITSCCRAKYNECNKIMAISKLYVLG